MDEQYEHIRKLAEDLVQQANDSRLALLYHTAYATLDELEEEMKSNMAYLEAKAILAEIDKKVTQLLQDRGCSSIATPHGTIHTVGKTTARIMDPEEFWGFAVRSNRPQDFLDLKANMTSCRAYVEKTGQPVPGVELNTYRRVSITSPKKKGSTDDE